MLEHFSPVRKKSRIDRKRQSLTFVFSLLLTLLWFGLNSLCGLVPYLLILYLKSQDATEKGETIIKNFYSDPMNLTTLVLFSTALMGSVAIDLYLDTFVRVKPNPKFIFLVPILIIVITVISYVFLVAGLTTGKDFEVMKSIPNICAVCAVLYCFVIKFEYFIRTMKIS